MAANLNIPAADITPALKVMIEGYSVATPPAAAYLTPRTAQVAATPFVGVNYTQ